MEEVGTIDDLMGSYYRLPFNEVGWFETAQKVNQEVIVSVIPDNFIWVEIADVFGKIVQFY